MKKTGQKPTEEIHMKAPNFVTILAILAEMARRVNENISKIDLKPIDQTLAMPGIVDSNGAAAGVSKA
jgi:hypothetical protein